MLRKLPAAVVMLIAALILVSAPASAQELYDGSTPTTGTNSHEVITTIENGTECRRHSPYTDSGIGRCPCRGRADEGTV